VLNGALEIIFLYIHQWRRQQQNANWYTHSFEDKLEQLQVEMELRSQEIDHPAVGSVQMDHGNSTVPAILLCAPLFFYSLRNNEMGAVQFLIIMSLMWILRI